MSASTRTQKHIPCKNQPAAARLRGDLPSLPRKPAHMPQAGCRTQPIARNLTWGTDLTGKTDANRNQHPIFGIIDHGSRTLLRLQAFNEKVRNKLAKQQYRRALIDLNAQALIADGVRHTLTPGMQVTAEIHLGSRTILEYLLSPVTSAFQEAGRER
ncbi:MAG: hypothetical protein PHY62_03510 [Gallionella sp.]|nr:hypothetical protein [Gallionella sp.]